MLLYINALMLVFLVAAFGATYVLVRKTPYAPYSILLSFVSFQPFLLGCVTLFGYRMPVPLKPAMVFAPILGGIGLTAFVALRHRSEIVASLRETWKSTLFIYGLAMASIILATPILVGSTSLAYIDWWNGELVNYSYFAHAFLNKFHDPNYIPFFEHNTSLRYGAELFLAALSTLTGDAPLWLVEVLSALYKVSAIVAFAVSCEIVRKERAILPLAVIAANVGFAFATILSLNHVLAFLAAQAVTGSAILLSLGLLANGIRSRRVQILLAIHVLFIVITYGEALPLLCILGALVFIEAAWNNRKDITAAILVIFGTGLLLNPLITVQRLEYLYRLKRTIAGFNVLGNPRDDLSSYLAAALGFQYPFLNIPPLPRTLLVLGIRLAVPAIASALVVSGRRLRTLLFLGILLLFVLVHLDLTTNAQPVTSAYYKSYKVIAALYFYVFFALAFLLDTLLRRRPWRRPSGPPELLLLVGVCVFIGGNILVSSRAAAAIKGVPSVYHKVDVERALVLMAARGEPAVILAKDNSAALWDLLANYSGVARLLLDQEQASIVYHNRSVNVIEPTIVHKPLAQSETTQPGILFSGIVVIPRIAAYSPVPLILNTRWLLETIAPGLRLKEQKVLLTTSAFRVVEGTLIDTGNSSTTADGRPNEPPVVAGVVPKQGEGSYVTLSFTYSDPNGLSDVDAALININSTPDTTNGCYISYSRPADRLGLEVDGGASWDTKILGSSKILENRNCAIDAYSSTTGAGNEFTLHLVVRFKRTFAGAKTIYTTVADESKLTTGWQSVGVWSVPSK